MIIAKGPNPAYRESRNSDVTITVANQCRWSANVARRVTAKTNLPRRLPICDPKNRCGTIYPLRPTKTLWGTFIFCGTHCQNLTGHNYQSLAPSPIASLQLCPTANILDNLQPRHARFKLRFLGTNSPPVSRTDRNSSRSPVLRFSPVPDAGLNGKRPLKEVTNEFQRKQWLPNLFKFHL